MGDTAVPQAPQFARAHGIAAACYAMAGCMEVKRACALVLKLDPSLCISGNYERSPYLTPEHLKNIQEGMRLADPRMNSGTGAYSSRHHQPLFSLRRGPSVRRSQDDGRVSCPLDES